MSSFIQPTRRIYILFMFHDSFVTSVMTFGPICWWDNLSTEYTPFPARSLDAIHPIPLWSSCTSQGHCKWHRKSFLTPSTSYTIITTFSPVKGNTECQL